MNLFIILLLSLCSATHPTLNETVRMQQDVVVQNDEYDLIIHMAKHNTTSGGVCSPLNLTSCIACKERLCIPQTFAHRTI